VNKWLLVGDCHAVEEELEDMSSLIDGIVKTIEYEKPEYVCFMGDQHHNHKMVNVEVMNFWQKSFEKIKKTGAKVLALVGNHDMPGDSSSDSHAMSAYQIKVINKLTVIDDVIILMPYFHSNEDFINQLSAQKLEGRIILCHATFDGCKFENGFYAPNGIDATQFDNAIFISGHIHTPQSFGNVTYIGAPRWRNVNDANIDRAIYLYDFGNNSNLIKKIDTSQWCRKLIQLEIKQGQKAPKTEIDSRHKYVIDIYGDENFCKEEKKNWVSCRVRTFNIEKKAQIVSESMGIAKALDIFSKSFTPKYGTSKEVLQKTIKERIQEF
jgi:DNA repair exonuclease SbcCD nuclease subunit